MAGLWSTGVETVFVYVALLLVAAAITAGLGIYASRHREVPGATAFVLLMASLTVWTAGYAAGALAEDVGLRLWIERFQWFGFGTTPLWLLLFALAYTGYDEFFTRQRVAALGAVPAASILGAWTNHLHGLMWTGYGTETVDGFVVVDVTLGPFVWVFVAYAWAAVVVTAALFVRMIYRSDYLYADQSILVLVGLAVPFVASLVDLLVLDHRGIDPTPFALTITGLTMWEALFRRRLFDLVPATRQLGRNPTIGQLAEGILIVDTERRVVYCNEAAGDVLGVAPAETTGRDVRTLLDDTRIDFDAPDALAEIERDGRVHEVRTSPITDRQGRRIGHTLVVHDVTTRKERERRLAAQRDELARLEELNAVLRGVNQALVSASDRDAIERAVAERLAAADRYGTVCVADLATWTGDGDRWTVAGEAGVTDGAPPAPTAEVDDDLASEDEDVAMRTLPASDAGDGGTWAVVPVAYGRTVYGAIGLYTDREGVGDRERAVLAELGETIGHAINAVESEQLLSADRIVEIELESTDGADPLVSVSAETATRLGLAGLVPGSDGTTLAYVQLEGSDVEAARDRLTEAADGTVRTIRLGETDGLLEWTLGGDSVLGTLVDYGVHVRDATAEDGRVRYEVEVSSGTDVRTVRDHVDARFPDTRIVSKRERAAPVEEPASLSGASLEDLTDRQREALEAAYRAGYFDWPRESSAEEVATALDITAPTLHAHLRKAESTMLADLFDGPGDGD